MKKVFEGNLEVEMLHMLISAMTIFFVFLGLGVDILTHRPLKLWLVFLMLSVVLFIISFFVKYIPKTAFVFVLMFLISTGLLIGWFLFYQYHELFVIQITVMFLYLTSMALLFYLFTRSLTSGGIVDMNIKNKLVRSTSSSSKLRRRKSRRQASKAHMTIGIKSGQYRG